MNNGYNRLANTVGRQVQREMVTNDALELGTIQSDGSLKVDQFAKPFKLGQYLRTRAAETLVSGQRVLVAWTNGGTDPVIIDVVVTE